MRRLATRLREETGQASIEFAGVLVWMLLAALLVWQLMLVTWTFNQASNAARTASRADGRGGSGEKAGRAALSPGLRKHAKVDRTNDHTVRVKLKVPVLFPGVHTNWKVTSEAGTVIEDEPLPASQRGGS